MSVGIGVKAPDIGGAPDHYTVQRGRATLWGGGPMVSGDGSLTNVSGTDNIYADTSYRINEDGSVKSWTVFQTDTTTLPHVIGEIKLIILRQSGSEYTIVGVGEMDRDIHGSGIVEFPADIPVLRNDIVGFWLKDATTFGVGRQDDLDDPTGGSTIRVLEFFSLPDPQQDDNLGTASFTGGDLYMVAVRGEIDGDSIADVDIVWRTNDSVDDDFGYRQFVRSTDAFEESNVTDPTNLFTNIKTDEASVALGVTTLNNVYYYLDEGLSTEVVPVARVIIHCDTVIPAGGIVRIFWSADATQAQTLAGAQAIAAVDWNLVIELDENSNPEQQQDAMYHIGREAKWLRLEIVGATAAATTVGAFEAQIVDEKITDGSLDPHPDTALKSRFQFTPESFLGASQMSAVVTRTVLGTALVVFCENAPVEFFTNITVGSYIYLRHGLPLGSSGVMVRVKVTTVDAGAFSITFEAPPGEDFQIGSFVDPEVWFFRFNAFDAQDVLFATSNWVGGHSTKPPWMRTHDVFVTAGN